MADVPHAWPAYLLPEQKQAHPRGARAEQARDLEHQRLHDARGQRSAAEVLAPVVDRAGRHYRQIRIDHTKRALTLAKELGAERASPPSPAGRSKAGSWGECLKLFVEMLKPVVEHAEKEQVLLLVEPEPDLLIETADQYLEFASKISSPALGLNFDIGHSYCVKDEPADDDPPARQAHPPRPPGRHRRDARAPPPDPGRRGDRLRRARSRRSRRWATTAG